MQFCYDSHLHLYLTGEQFFQLDLKNLRNQNDFQKLDLSRKEKFLRGNILMGFGWDENLWDSSLALNKKCFDQIFPDDPVFFIRADAHSAILNSRALEFFNLSENSIGIISESLLYACLAQLPARSSAQQEEILKTGHDLLVAQGFKYVREMSGSLDLLECGLQLEMKNQWQLGIEWNFVCSEISGLDNLIEKILHKKKNLQSLHHRIQGVKIFLDGSLGSNTAAVSEQAELLWSDADFSQALRKIWQAQLDCCIHTIGDVASLRAAKIARKISAEGISGRIHFEHCQVMNPETIQIMKALHVVCHLQPCHWLSDRQWLKEKLEKKYSWAFPWEALRRAKIPFYFGSDSPIEAPSLENNLRALRESALEGIPELSADPLIYHQHPDPWLPVTD